MKVWEKRVFVPDLNIADSYVVGNIRNVRLIASPIKHQILSNIILDTIGYNGTTPGPLILARQGEIIQIEVINNMNEPTALHVHGYAKPNSQDGAPDIGEPTPTIQPGESYTYQFFLWQSGTFFYHSTTKFQSNEGLIGPFVVLPNEESIKQEDIPDKDYILLTQQWEIPQPKLGQVYPGTYKPNKFGINSNFFTFNGKAFPDTSLIPVSYGENIRLRFINKSNSSHSMHLHGHDFMIVEADGFPRCGPMHDTLNVASGQRFSVEFTANNPGIWPLNGTKTFHRSNNGDAPGGMISRLVYT